MTPPLISAARLRDALRDVTVLDCRFALDDVARGRRAYAAGHLPNAFYADLNRDLAAPVTPTSGRHPLPEVADFAKRLARFGIRPGRRVVVYDDAGGGIAARAWWMLRHWLGLPAAMLDGGINAWQRAGFELQTQAPKFARTDPDTWRANAECIASIDEVQTVRGMLIDARANARYRGEKEPIDARAGHVPGAQNFPFSENLNAAGEFLQATQLRQRFADVHDAIHMCGSGVTACHNILAMEIAGLAPGRLYVGSWSEWITDPARPVVTENPRA